MHKILVHPLFKNKAHIGETDFRVRGFLVGIEPPITVSQEIIDRAIDKNSLEPRFEATTSPFSEVTLIGSTDERTTLYAHLIEETYDTAEILDANEMIVDRTKNLLGLMGIYGTMVDVMNEPVTGTLVV